MSQSIVFAGDYRHVKTIEAVANRVEAKFLGHGTFDLYETEERGLGVQLKNWKLPIVCRDDGSLVYDNHKGHWGDIKELERFRQMYPGELAKQLYGNRIQSVTETVLSNGDVEVQIKLADTESTGSGSSGSGFGPTQF